MTEIVATKDRMVELVRVNRDCYRLDVWTAEGRGKARWQRRQWVLLTTTEVARLREELVMMAGEP